jgi:hypothetical protein
MNGAKYEHTQNISMQRILQVRLCCGVVLSLLALLTYLCMYVLRLLCVGCLCYAQQPLKAMLLYVLLCWRWASQGACNLLLVSLTNESVLFWSNIWSIIWSTFGQPSVKLSTCYCSHCIFLQACLTLQSIQQDMEQQAAAQGSEAGAAALTPAQQTAISAARRSEALQRFTAGWLRLQNEVNALIDSTTAENTDQAVRGTVLCSRRRM